MTRDPVIPAQAGTQHKQMTPLRVDLFARGWAPACAGVTTK
jgi:hypothetical protein